MVSSCQKARSVDVAKAWTVDDPTTKLLLNQSEAASFHIQVSSSLPVVIRSTTEMSVWAVPVRRLPGLQSGGLLLAAIIAIPGESQLSRYALQGSIAGGSLLMAHSQQGPEFCAEAFIEPTVDEGVVAGTAHGHPMESKVKGVAVTDGLVGHEDQVAIQGEPADTKHQHDHQQHLQGHLLFPLMGIVLIHGHIANGVPHPEFLGH